MVDNPWTIPPNSSDPLDVFLSRTFHYRPNVGAATFGIVAFGFLGLMSLYLTYKYGGRFMSIVAGTGFSEMVGYGIRLGLTLGTTKLSIPVYSFSAVLILLPPVVLGLVNFLVVSKLVNVTGVPIRILGCWKVQPNRIARTFFFIDIFTLTLQCGGTGLQFVQASTLAQHLGLAVVIVGLVLQFMFVSAFVLVLHQVSTDPVFGLNSLVSLRKVFFALRITVGCLVIRHLFRIIEFATGTNGPVSTREWTFYNFDTYPILVALITHCLFHFGRLLECNNPNPGWIAEYNDAKARKQTSEREEVGDAESLPGCVLHSDGTA